jgi:small subunit ribosomal protein S16
LLVIRLARTGRAKYPTYRIVAAESARAATGKFVAVLGHYNPHTKELVIKREEVEKRLSQGAQPSNTVIKLLQRDKVELPQWVKLKTKAPKKTEAPAEEGAEATAPKSKAAADEAPAAEKPAETEEVRVAEVNEEAAAGAEANAPDVDSTDTAASEAETAERLEAADNTPVDTK